MDKVVPPQPRRIEGITDGVSLSVGGFGLCGMPSVLIAGLQDAGVTDLEAVSNNCGVDDWGLGILLRDKRIRRMVASYVGENKEFARQYLCGELEVELCPQGTLAERLRAGDPASPRSSPPPGSGTQVAEGGMPWRYAPDGSVAIASPAKETRELEWMGQTRTVRPRAAIVADYGLVRAWKGDRHGNLVFHSRRATSTRSAAMAGRLTVAEVEDLVEPGEIEPDEVHLPGIYVQRVLPLTPEQAEDKRIEAHVTAAPGARSRRRPDMPLTREQMAARAAAELHDGDLRQPRHRAAHDGAQLRARRRRDRAAVRERPPGCRRLPGRRRPSTPTSSTRARRRSPCAGGPRSSTRPRRSA